MAKLTVQNISKSLHRDLGYFFIGITLVYAITGFVLSARGLGWFKYEYKTELSIPKHIKTEDFTTIILEKAKEGKLPSIYEKGAERYIERRIERLSLVERKDNTFVYAFSNLSIIYHSDTGKAKVVYQGYNWIVRLFISAHLSSNSIAWYYLGMSYSIVLAFFAISAIFMVKGKYGFKKRGIYFAFFGILTIPVFIYLSFY